LTRCFITLRTTDFGCAWSTDTERLCTAIDQSVRALYNASCKTWTEALNNEKYVEKAKGNDKGIKEAKNKMENKTRYTIIF